MVIFSGWFRTVHNGRQNSNFWSSEGIAGYKKDISSLATVPGFLGSGWKLSPSHSIQVWFDFYNWIFLYSSWSFCLLNICVPNAGGKFSYFMICHLILFMIMVIKSSQSPPLCPPTSFKRWGNIVWEEALNKILHLGFYQGRNKKYISLLCFVSQLNCKRNQRYLIYVFGGNLFTLIWCVKLGHRCSQQPVHKLFNSWLAEQKTNNYLRVIKVICNL